MSCPRPILVVAGSVALVGLACAGDITTNPGTPVDTPVALGDGGVASPWPTADAGPTANQCVVSEIDENAPPTCTAKAPPGSFEPDVQWTFTPPGEPDSIVMPLVANLTDDNGDGLIDLCDTPDILVVAASTIWEPGHIYVLDGSTGALHKRFDEPVETSVTPALGDIDGDGLPEIVAASPDCRLLALEHDGTLKWRSAFYTSFPECYSSAFALVDLQGDGQVEILLSRFVFDHAGALLWTAADDPASWAATTAADLDGDGDLEVVLGRSAFHHDGTTYYRNVAVAPGYPQVADLDGDDLPEVLVTNENGLTLLEHDGSIKYADRRPTNDPVSFAGWIRPATIHDFDGDGAPEYAMSSANHYTVYEADGTILWSAPVSDQSGIAAGTAFDFLGDGTAEAMYADETTMYVFGDSGQVLLTTPRMSGTLIEYPIVADVDNDGSAEIVVVSNQYTSQPTSPTVQVIRDREDRWIQARRIWNQHTYHVTNVREDGTIPQHETPSWTGLNTFRTNAQIGDGGICLPAIE